MMESRQVQKNKYNRIKKLFHGKNPQMQNFGLEGDQSQVQMELEYPMKMAKKHL